MLKGVNKLIVEINNPESEYFERAIFFLKPNKKDTMQRELNESADLILKGTALKKRDSTTRLTEALKYLTGALIGAVVMGSALIIANIII